MSSRCGRDRARRGALVVAVALLALAAPAAAQEEPDDAAADLGMAVEVGYGDRTAGAEWVPALVTLQPARLVAGTLAVEVRTEGGTLSEEREVEVAVGSRNAYRFVLPRGALTVTLRERGSEPVTLHARPARDSAGTYLVGVLGVVPASPPPLRSETLGASGAWVDVDPEWAELSAAALQPLSGLVADGAALAGLSEQGRRNVAAATADGMDLLLVEPVAADVGLPWALDGQAWTLPAGDVADGEGGDAATVVPAGRGRVALVPAAVGQGALGRSAALWSALVEPRIAPAVGGGGGVLPGGPGSLLGGAEPDLPALPWFAVFLVAYVLVVGPVNGLVLARLGRRELAWVTVPAVTVVFTAGGWLGAVGAQPPVGFAGAASVWADGAATEWVAVVARTPTPSERRLTLPGDDWAVRPLSPVGPAVMRRHGDVQVDLGLPALQPGAVVARRAVDAPAPLQVDASGTAEGLEVRVENVSGATVAGVAVRAATATVDIGDLAPGAAETVTVSGTHLPADEGGLRGHALDELSSDVALGSLLAGVLDGNPGLVWALGSVTDSDTGARVDGGPTTDLGRVVAVGARATGRTHFHTVDRALVHAGEGSFRPTPLMVEGQGAAILRYRLPPGPSAPRLHADLAPEAFGGGGPRPEVALWQRAERQWRPLSEALPELRVPDRGGRAGATGAPGDYVSPLGEVHVRVAGPLFPLGFAPMGLTVDDAP